MSFGIRYIIIMIVSRFHSISCELSYSTEYLLRSTRNTKKYRVYSQILSVFIKEILPYLKS